MNQWLDTLHHTSLQELCAALPKNSVDMVLCDPPYGTTACSWDSVIPFAELWAGLMRVIKPRGAIVLFGSQPFTSALIMSNPSWFKYCWVWNKKLATNFLNAKHQPLKQHEDVCVFADEVANYYPIMRIGTKRMKGPTKDGFQGVTTYGNYKSNIKINDQYYPTSILEFSGANQSAKQHPTQKPVSLCEYLISTYTQPDQIVLDPTCGSGTTGVAARNIGRRYILSDTSAEYVQVARKRLEQPFTKPMMDLL